MVGSTTWVLLEIYLAFQQWKNFDNPLRIDKVIAMSSVCSFLAHPVYIADVILRWCSYIRITSKWVKRRARLILLKAKQSISVHVLSASTSTVVPYTRTSTLHWIHRFTSLSPRSYRANVAACMTLSHKQITALIYHACRFIFSTFFFNISVCSVWWTKLATRQLFTARYIHNIVSYRIAYRARQKWPCQRNLLLFVKVLTVIKQNLAH